MPRAAVRTVPFENSQREESQYAPDERKRKPVGQIVRPRIDRIAAKMPGYRYESKGMCASFPFPNGSPRRKHRECRFYADDTNRTDRRSLRLVLRGLAYPERFLFLMYRSSQGAVKDFLPPWQGSLHRPLAREPADATVRAAPSAGTPERTIRNHPKRHFAAASGPVSLVFLLLNYQLCRTRFVSNKTAYDTA